MDLSASTAWWLLAGAVVAAELATGTFYLLMIAVGLAGGALAAHAGLPLAGQIATAAALGSGATGVWHWRRMRRPRSAPSERNADMLLDIGQRVQVEAWRPDGTADVVYRGARWSARAAAPDDARAPGGFQVVAVEGSTLVLQAVVGTAASPPTTPQATPR